MTARAGVEKGRHVPSPHTIKELLKDKEKMEKHAAESRKWVQAGMYVVPQRFQALKRADLHSGKMTPQNTRSKWRNPGDELSGDPYCAVAGDTNVDCVVPKVAIHLCCQHLLFLG